MSRLVPLAILLLMFANSAEAQVYNLDWLCINSGGAEKLTSDSYGAMLTYAQPVAGKCEGGIYKAHFGFWHPMIRSCCNIAGDANNDGFCNVGDAVHIINYIYKFNNCDTNPPYGCPPECMAEGDANNDGSCNVGDVVYIINYIYRFGQCSTNPPTGCPPECGPMR